MFRSLLPVAAAVLLVAAPMKASPATVTASWYGSHWAGRHTASGERFNPHKLTAASRTLPLGTRVRVRYHNHSVVVRINDRGPYVHGRGMDLSEAAARKLGMRKRGVARVQYKVLSHRR
jgi:rare lipoprotein A